MSIIFIFNVDGAHHMLDVSFHVGGTMLVDNYA
jgi:hypothetical protein